ncbi:MAG: hypothetical protein ACI8RD_008011 [Bacillariaceae sp.]|jgi:hypothetical protein
MNGGSSSHDVTMTPVDNGSHSQSQQNNQYWRDDFRPLRDAGKNVLQMLRRDETSVHADLYRRIMSTNQVGRSSRTSSASRTGNDADSNPAHRYFPYDSDDTSKKGDSANNSSNSNGNNGNSNNNNNNVDASGVAAGPIKHAQTIPLPPYLREVRSKAKVAILMGLFPEAQLAWMTTDDTVYLWAYHQNSGNINGIRSGGCGSSGVENQFLEFKVPSGQPIVSVGLAPPKKGELVIHRCIVLLLYFTTRQIKRIILS